MHRVVPGFPLDYGPQFAQVNSVVDDAFQRRHFGGLNLIGGMVTWQGGRYLYSGRRPRRRRVLAHAAERVTLGIICSRVR